MTQNVQNILKKITFIETDLELQKQILFSIPTEQTDDMETQVKKIAGLKDEINGLREQIKTIAPDEYAKIIAFEKAADQFKEISKNKKFTAVTTLSQEDECTLTLTDDTTIACIVKAQDENGHWTVFTLDGDVLQYEKKDVVS